MASQALERKNNGDYPLDQHGPCLLSLDGGGVRGLSTLYILKNIMDKLNDNRQKAGSPAVQPCEIFDLIGGTSTGGLIAIMLGRLQMDVDTCITAYTELMKSIFEEKSSWLPFTLGGKTQARFDSSKLEDAINKVITSSGNSVNDLFNDGVDRGCKVFVCATSTETSGIRRIRSYQQQGVRDISATISKAASATSAATTFFSPVSIGRLTFFDGALGANNPAEEVEGEAANIWCPETAQLQPLVKCFISIGTGDPGKKPIANSALKFLTETLPDMALETEKTAERVIGRFRGSFDNKRYFRFNVQQGLQNVGLAEYNAQGTIEAATDEYLDSTEQKFRVRDCIKNLEQKQSLYMAEDFS